MPPLYPTHQRERGYRSAIEHRDEAELLDASEDIDRLLSAPPDDMTPALRRILLVLDDALNEALADARA